MTGKNRKKRVTGMILAASLLACGYAAPASAEDTQTIRVGSILALGTAAPFAAIENGLFNDGGMEIEVSEFSDGTALMEAFAAGEIDIAFSGIVPVATWISKGVNMQIVASANGGGHVLMTRKDAGIESVEDLKDQLVAEPSVATVTDALLRAKILGDAGLNADTDVALIPGMKPADMATVLMATKEVEAMITWEPYAAEAEAMYGDEIVVLYDASAVIKEETGSDAFYPVNVVAASQDFIDNRSEELEEFLDIYKQTVDFLNEDEEANAVLASVLELDEEVVESARERIDYTYDIDKEGSMETLKWAEELGYISELPAEEDLFLD